MSRAFRAAALAGVAAALACACSSGARAGATGFEAAPARVSVTNLVEAQFGNDPFASFLGQPENATSTYDQLSAEVAWGGLLFGFRHESLDDSQDEASAREFTQRYAEVRADGLRVRAGDFYSILGRGLTFRAFELPGVVLQDPGSRARRSFSRERDGVLAEGAWGPASVRALSSSDDDGTISGGEFAADVWRGSRAGVTYVRTTNAGATLSREAGSGFLELDPFALAGLSAVALPVYAEYAQLDRSFGEFFELRTGDRVPHALYVSTELVAGPFAASVEWKDYRDFRLGTNDPPSLVREHAYALPNRATHVLNAESEHGVQAELSWGARGWGALTLNHSRSAGTPAGSELRFEENYAELHVAPERVAWLEGTAFFDRGFDTFASIREREIYGASATVRAFGPWSATLDLERLDAERRNLFAPNEGWTDLYASVQLARASWGSIAWLWQRTTDPLEEEPDLFGGTVDPRTYRAVTASAVLGRAHTLQLFVGERRGGPACTAGTCYEVQPFEGAELRLVSRF